MLKVRIETFAQSAGINAEVLAQVVDDLPVPAARMLVDKALQYGPYLPGHRQACPGVDALDHGQVVSHELAELDVDALVEGYADIAAANLTAGEARSQPVHPLLDS